MPNISFEEKQGASYIRRIIAGLWIIIVFAGAVAYINFAPREYHGSMELCYNAENKKEVFTLVEKAFTDNNVTAVTIENVESERLIIGSKAGQISTVKNNLQYARTEIEKTMNSKIDENYTLLQNQYDSNLATLKEKLTQAKKESAESKEHFLLLDEMEAAIKTRQSLPAGWEMMFADNLRYQSILTEMVDSIAAIEEIEIKLKAEAAKMLVLSEWINNPQNQTIQIMEKRVVHYEDSPELIKLKDKRAALEASRLSLLIRATLKHPEVIRMTAEIKELDMQINALIRNPRVVEDVREITNPKLAVCKTEIVNNRALIAGLNSRLETLISKSVMRLGDLRMLVRDAQKDITADRQEYIENEITMLKKSRPVKDKSIVLGYIISGNFDRIKAPDLTLIYGGAAFLSIVGTVLLLYSRKKSSFKLEEVEATPEFPVLGRIGKIGGSTITKV